MVVVFGGATIVAYGTFAELKSVARYVKGSGGETEPWAIPLPSTKTVLG
jgi:hypothetical protein